MPQQRINKLIKGLFKRRYSTAYLLFLCAHIFDPTPSYATIEEVQQETVETQKEPSFGDLFLSAYKKPALEVWKYSSPILIGAILTREDTINHNQKEVANNRSLRGHSMYGDWAGRLYINAMYVGGFAIAGQYLDSTYFANSKAMLWASAMSGLTAQVLKHVVRERRPPPDHDNPQLNSRDRKSFPSGHTTSAFTFASVVQQFHGWYWGAPAYALATFVGWSRMDDNKHYLHDVLFGAAIGATYGVGVSHLYKEKNPSDNMQSLLLIPEEGGAQFRYSFAF